MLSTPERIAPYEADEIAADCGVSRTTAYSSLRKLSKHGMVLHVRGGYVIGKEILLAGVRYHAALSKLKINEVQEKIHGKK